jgi:hypothetical protein
VQPCEHRADAIVGGHPVREEGELTQPVELLLARLIYRFPALGVAEHRTDHHRHKFRSRESS